MRRIYRPTKEAEQNRKIRARLRMIRRYEQVTHNISKTCRFFGISRSQFYVYLDRFKRHGPEGLRDGKRGPKRSPFRTPPHIEALILAIRAERQYGAVRISMFLQRYHQVYVSPPAILRILRENRVPRVSLKRYRPGPTLRANMSEAGGSV